MIEEHGKILLEGLIVRTPDAKVRHFANIALANLAQYVLLNAPLVVDVTLDAMEG